jgi:hypothetical protein
MNAGLSIVGESLMARRCTLANMFIFLCVRQKNLQAKVMDTKNKI